MYNYDMTVSEKTKEKLATRNPVLCENTYPVSKKRVIFFAADKYMNKESIILLSNKTNEISSL